jgi:hypothetical protein
VTEPLRAAPLLGSTDTVTDPLPVPLVGDSLTQERLSDVVQVQPELDASTDTVLLPLPDPKLPLVGDMPYVHAAAFWVMLYVLPAMLTHPLRAPPVLGSTDTVTDPLPIPLVGDKLTQDRLSEVVQVQFERDAVTETDALSPPVAKFPLEGEISYVQDASTWVISYVSPAMVTEPLRASPVLGSTDTVIDPLPVPLVGDKLTQDRLSDVTQLQLERDAVTETDALSLPDEKLPLGGDISYVQDASPVSATQRTERPFRR